MLNSPLPDRSHIETEKRLEASKGLHQMDTSSILATMQKEDHSVTKALEDAAPQLAKFINDCFKGFKNGGRLIYFGAGTSGRLGVLDASETPPTFQLDQGRIIGLIAGGDKSLRFSSEGREDLEDEFIASLKDLNLTGHDTVLGIAAGGTTPCVHGALKYVSSESPKSLRGFMSCTPLKEESYITHPVFLNTGPEVLTGSTRLKAGTATKLALNQISTTLMILYGKVYENLMVDLKASNLKLIDRAVRIITTLTTLSREEALSLLKQAQNKTKVAIVMHHNKLNYEDAQTMLNKNEQHLHRCL